MKYRTQGYRPSGDFLATLGVLLVIFLALL